MVAESALGMGVTDDDTQRVTAHGKEVCLDGRHLADADGDEAAAVIAICLNRAGLHPDRWPHDERLRVANFFA